MDSIKNMLLKVQQMVKGGDGKGSYLEKIKHLVEKLKERGLSPHLAKYDTTNLEKLNTQLKAIVEDVSPDPVLVKSVIEEAAKELEKVEQVLDFKNQAKELDGKHEKIQTETVEQVKRDIQEVLDKVKTINDKS